MLCGLAPAQRVPFFREKNSLRSDIFVTAERHSPHRSRQTLLPDPSTPLGRAETSQKALDGKQSGTVSPWFSRPGAGVSFLPGKRCLSAASCFSQKKRHPGSRPATQTKPALDQTSGQWLQIVHQQLQIGAATKGIGIRLVHHPGTGTGVVRHFGAGVEGDAIDDAAAFGGL